jgi:pyruvate dehydrogenase E1 component beta subunit
MARVVSEGADVTLLVYGSLVGRSMGLRTRFAEAGVSVDILDLRTLDRPGIDFAAIGRSLEKTGAVVIAEEASASQSIGSAIAATIMERYFHMLDAPVVRVTSLDIPLPVSRVLEKATAISDDRICDVVVSVARRVWQG